MSYVNGTQTPAFGLPPAFADIENPGTEAYLRAPAFGNGSDSIAPFGSRVPQPFAQSGAGDGLGSLDPLQGMFGGAFASVVANLLQTLSGLLSQLGALFGSASGGSAGVNAGSTPCSPQTRFAGASASSNGDPHDALTGTTASGAAVDAHWDDMHSHADLLDSDSFRGGYRVSTTATAPDAHGVTYNASASIATDGGRDIVRMNSDGSYTVSDDGQPVSLTPGQSTALDRGETVTLNADGSLTVAGTARDGGRLTTSLRWNGHGVDIDAQATGVDLGGYLVDRSL